MRAISWEGKEKVSVSRTPTPKILNPHDAIIRVTLTAICGSDLHIYGGYIPTMKKGDITVRAPEVRYLAEERALVAPEEIVLEGPRTEVSGKGLYIDLARKRLILKEHRLTKLKLEKGLL